jgi:hypothetical protein
VLKAISDFLNQLIGAEINCPVKHSQLKKQKNALDVFQSGFIE